MCCSPLLIVYGMLDIQNPPPPPLPLTTHTQTYTAPHAAAGKGVGNCRSCEGLCLSWMFRAQRDTSHFAPFASVSAQMSTSDLILTSKVPRIALLNDDRMQGSEAAAEQWIHTSLEELRDRGAREGGRGKSDRRSASDCPNELLLMVSCWRWS